MKKESTILGIFALILTNSIAFGQKFTASFADDLTENKPEKTVMTFNKRVKVSNQENGKSVVLRINDKSNAEGNNKLAILGKSNETLTASLKSTKGKVKIQDIEDESGEIERFWATADASVKSNMNVSPAFKATASAKEIEIETVKIEGFAVNHVYDLKGNIKETDGFGLQLAAFTQLNSAKEYADKVVKKGEADASKIFIQVSKAEDKPMVYRVVYGFFQSENSAKETQKKMANYGFDALVKGFN